MTGNDILLFVRCALLIACVGAVSIFCMGAALRRGEGAAGAAVRILVTLIAPATALAFIGLFFWPIALGASLLAAAWQGAGASAPLWGRLREVWNATSLVSRVALFAVGVACVYRAGAALSMPPTDGDSLLYHLPMTAALVQDHGMWFTRALLYPGAAELSEAIGGAGAANVNGVVVFELVEILSLGLVGFGWARRAGASIDGAAATAVVAIALPLVIDQMFTAQNDIFACTTIAAACALWRNAPRLAALSIGLAFGAKVTAFVLVPAIAVVMIAFEGWPFSFGDIGWAVALAAPWYVRNLVLTGSPLYTVASLGWSSTLAANFAHTWRLMLSALRTYGGLTVVAGTIALAFLPMRARNSFERALPWLAVAAFVSWIALPDSAESVPGTLDQITQGWSLRYALLLPFVLATALPIVLDRLTRVPVAALAALAAATSAIVRSANLTASNEPAGFVYGVPLISALIVIMIGFFAGTSLEARRQSAVTAGALALALIIVSVTMVAGALSIRKFWSASYLQWSPRIPASTVVIDKHVESHSRVAVVGMRAFPLVGPAFERETFENVIIEGPEAWLARLRKSNVSILVAAGESGAPDQPGFLQPLPVETRISQSAGVCKLATHGYVRVYGLDLSVCSRSDPTLRPTQHR